MARTEQRTRGVSAAEVDNLLAVAEQVAQYAREWIGFEKQRDTAEQNFAHAAWLYAQRYSTHGAADPLTLECHEVMMANFRHSKLNRDLPGATPEDTPELIRVFIALECGADSLRSACALARAGNEISTDQSHAAKARAREILAHPQDDDSFRARARRARVLERWIKETQHRLAIVNGFIARGEWSADQPEVAKERERLRRRLAPHVTPTEDRS